MAEGGEELPRQLSVYAGIRRACMAWQFRDGPAGTERVMSAATTFLAHALQVCWGLCWPCGSQMYVLWLLGGVNTGKSLDASDL